MLDGLLAIDPERHQLQAKMAKKRIDNCRRAIVLIDSGITESTLERELEILLERTKRLDASYVSHLERELKRGLQHSEIRTKYESDTGYNKDIKQIRFLRFVLEK